MMTRRSLASAMAALVLMAACGGDDAGGNDDATGGAVGGAATGGRPASGGAAAGGTSTSGGATTGGTPTTGGATTGGSPTTGGATTGGSPPSGGAITGGTPASGGASGGATSGGAAGGGADPGGAGGAAPVTGGRAGGGAMAGSAGAGGGAGEATAGSAGAGAEGGAGGATAGSAGAGAAAGGATAGGAGEGAGAGPAAGGATSSCRFPASAALANASLAEGFCAWTWATGLDEPRGAVTNDHGELIVIESGSATVTLLFDDDGDGVSGDDERTALAQASGLNHGVTLHGGYLYATSATTVFRWPYDGGRAPLGAAEVVVTGMPGDGHRTRTPAFDTDGYLYVSVGSASNVDANSDRARVVRFDPAQVEAGAPFTEAEVWADGTRNEVGLRFDAAGRLWGVENGSDNLRRDDLGGDIHDDNPGEEVNIFDRPGAFYGYPYCWSEGALPAAFAEGPGTQWAYPSAAPDDAWCRDPANVVPPVMVMQAHSAPLDLLFYQGGSFPADFVGDAFVTFHGSWNRDAATGYKVVRLPFGDDGMPTGTVEPLLEYAGAGDEGAGWPHRPVALGTTSDGTLLVTSDASNLVIAVGYDGG